MDIIRQYPTFKQERWDESDLIRPENVGHCFLVGVAFRVEGVAFRCQLRDIREHNHESTHFIGPSTRTIRRKLFDNFLYR